MQRLVVLSFPFQMTVSAHIKRATLIFRFSVWMLETGKCIRTFKHKKPVTSVALGEDLCISGCEAGNVKVWNMKNGKLIKVRYLISTNWSDLSYIKQC